MNDQLSTVLENYCDRVDDLQEPIEVDEILMRSEDIEIVPRPVDHRGSVERKPRFRVALPVAGLVAMVALAIAIGMLRPDGVRPNPPEDIVGTPTTILTNPSFLRPIGPLKPGVYLMAVNGSVKDIGVYGSVTSGWSGGRWNIHKARGEDLLAGVSVWEVGEIYAEPCNWNDTLFDPGPTVDELADALGTIPLRQASKPVSIVRDGYSGKQVIWSVPSDTDFDSCDTDPGDSFYDGRQSGIQPYFESWVTPTGGDNFEHEPGQIDELWILDVDGTRIVIDIWYTPLASATDLEELNQLVDSLEIDVR